MEAKSNRRAAAPDLADDGRSSGWRLRHHRCVRGVRPGRLRAREGERDRKENERERERVVGCWVVLDSTCTGLTRPCSCMCNTINQNSSSLIN
jgi:hypothetical protein